MTRRVLAVDDDHDVLYTLQAISEVGDFHLIPCDNGPEGLGLLRTEPFDLILVDYYMPEMNGMEFVKKVREFSDVPILVLTVDESLTIAHQFMEAGATDFATKPIRVADLISRIHVHLRLATEKLPPWFEAEELPKGMSGVTLQLIVEYLEGATEPENLDSISEGTGLAYQTVHRYVSYLDKQGIVEADLVYGKVGRPLKLYSKKR
ncbi:MAG: response regulator [Firmicutes bacterium]|nr:response regulator [Bacillota bacterium]